MENFMRYTCICIPMGFFVLVLKHNCKKKHPKRCETHWDSEIGSPNYRYIHVYV